MRRLFSLLGNGLLLFCLLSPPLRRRKDTRSLLFLVQNLPALPDGTPLRRIPTEKIRLAGIAQSGSQYQPSQCRTIHHHGASVGRRGSRGAGLHLLRADGSRFELPESSGAAPRLAPCSAVTPASRSQQPARTGRYLARTRQCRPLEDWRCRC